MTQKILRVTFAQDFLFIIKMDGNKTLLKGFFFLLQADSSLYSL